MFAEAQQFGIPFLGHLLLFDGEISLTHRHGQVWCALKDLEMTSLGTPGLSQLNTRCTSTDDGTFLALYRNLLVWPKGRVMNNALELIDTGPIRDIALSSKASANDQVLALGLPAVSSIDVPAALVFVELSTSDNALKSCLALNVNDPVTGIEIVPQVVVVWVVVRPVVPSKCQHEIFHGVKE